MSTDLRYFEKIDLSGANLTDSDLSNLNFSRARFDGANLSRADMSLSNFSGASFKNANLVAVEVSNSDFGHAIFETVEFGKINFETVEVKNAVFIESELSQKQLDQMGKDQIKVYASRAEYDARLSQNLEVLGQARDGVGSTPSRDDKRTKKNKYDVLFCTDRKPIIELGSVVNYGSQRSSAISYGVCEVIVPDGHKIGSLGSPLWKRLWNMKDDRLRIDDVITLNQELYFAHLRRQLDQMKVRERPTIFIHGYANSFRDAVLRAAQIGYDLGLGAGIGLFSWPSRGQTKHYSADEATVENSKYHLADYISDFVEAFPSDGINVIAHSMGCRCLLGAMEIIANKRKENLGKINQVILAAADVDVDLMNRIGVHPIAECARTTSYVAGKDKALLLSKWLHSYPRVGVSPPTYIMNGMDTVVVNDADLGEFSHQYVGTSRTVLADMFELLKRNTSPERRFSITGRSEAGQSYWRLKD